MLRMVVIILVIATAIGALMPSGPAGPSSDGNASDHAEVLTVSDSATDSGSSIVEPDGAV